MGDKLQDLFQVEKPIIGMIHLAGDSSQEKLERAIDELNFFQLEGVDGAIIEDYHGSMGDVEEVLREVYYSRFIIKIGTNILSNPYQGFALCSDYLKKGGFIQFDSVHKKDLDLDSYIALRSTHPDVVVLGGIRFKYTGETGNSLEADIIEGTSRCDVIVTTGEGTGIETPLEKLADFKERMNGFPLISGAGVTLDNLSEQLAIADGVIVGSYFKQDGKNTQLPIDKLRVRDFMQGVYEIRSQ